MALNKEHILPEWLYVPELEATIYEAKDLDDFLNNHSILLSVLNDIQEGISILSPNLDILYLNRPMRRWYRKKAVLEGQKCFHLFHEKQQPCQNCPAHSCLAAGLPKSGRVPFHQDGEKKGEMNLYISPIKNHTGEIVLLLEFIQNVTEAAHSKEQISELRDRVSLLEKQNQLLLRSLTLCEAKYQNLESIVTENMNHYILPALEYVKGKVPHEDLELVTKIIEQSIYPITKKHESALLTLTGREREVAVLIRDGYSSKQIADELFITKKAVDYHRSNIRKKLGLAGNANLRVFLQINL